MNLRKICVLVAILVLLCCSFSLILTAESSEYPPPDFTTPRMNNAEAVEKLVELATKYNTVYVNGTVGQPLSCDLIENTINSTSGNTDRAEQNKKRVPYNYYAFDCSGMVKALFLWEWDNGEYKYNENEEVNQSGLWELCPKASRSNIFTSYDSIMPGEFLYIEDEHCGMYIGGGYAIECTPKWNSGVQITRVVLDSEPLPDESEPARKWDSHGKLPFISYTCDNLYQTSTSGRLQLNKSVYHPGEPIRITVKGLSGDNYLDAHVAVYSTAFPTSSDNSLNNWCYVGSGTHDREDPPGAIATVYLDAKSYLLDHPQILSPGTYQVKLFADDGNTQAIDTLTFQVVYPQISKALYADGLIDVTIDGYIEEDAWIGLYQNGTTGSDSSPSILWHYATKEVTSRRNYGDLHYVTHLRFDASDAKISIPSAYQVVLYLDEGYNSAATKQLAATYQHTDILTQYTAASASGSGINIGPTVYEMEDEIKIDFYGVTNKDAWIGLYPAGTTNYNPCSTGMWVYTSTGTQWAMYAEYSSAFPANGTVYLHANVVDVNTGSLGNTPLGYYKLVLFGDSGYTNVLDEVVIRITY